VEKNIAATRGPTQNMEHTTEEEKERCPEESNERGKSSGQKDYPSLFGKYLEKVISKKSKSSGIGGLAK